VHESQTVANARGHVAAVGENEAESAQHVGERPRDNEERHRQQHHGVIVPAELLLAHGRLAERLRDAVHGQQQDGSAVRSQQHCARAGGQRLASVQEQQQPRVRKAERHYCQSEHHAAPHRVEQKLRCFLHLVFVQLGHVLSTSANQSNNFHLLYNGGFLSLIFVIL